MENKEKGEPFADLNPPKVIKSFLMGNELVTITESFYSNYQLEVYNFETKVTSWESVLVSPTFRKEWKIAHITADSRSNIFLTGSIPSEQTDELMINPQNASQMYILRRLQKDPLKYNANYGFFCIELINPQVRFSLYLHPETSSVNCLLNNSLYFIFPAQGTQIISKMEIEDTGTQNISGLFAGAPGAGGGPLGGQGGAQGGGGLFGGAQPGGGGGGLFGTRSPSRQAPDKRVGVLTPLQEFEGTAKSRFCSVMRENGKLYVFGGEDKDGQVLSELWEFDSKEKKWKNLSPENGEILARSGAVMCTDGDRLYICGGQNSKKEQSNDIIVYHFDDDRWEVHRLEAWNEPIHSCYYYYEQLLVGRGRRIDIGYHQGMKPYLEIFGQQNKESIKTKDNTLQDFRKLFAEMPYHDITFKVEDQGIPAHRALLSIRCPHFMQVFPAGIKDSKNKVIEIPDIKADVFKGLLEYLYCGEVPDDEKIVTELLKASETYQLEDLQNKCEDFLVLNLTIDNVTTLAPLAKKYKAQKLKNAALRFIKANENKFDEGDLNQFDKDFLIEIISFKNCK